MRSLKTLVGASVLLCATAANATVYNFQYQFDGTTLSASAGFPELFGTSLAVGDTVNLTYLAVGPDAYWDFSGVGVAGNVNLGFTYPDSCGGRSSSGAYAASNNGTTVLSNSYAVGSQSCIHLGPDFIDFTGITQVDRFEISYVMESSSAPQNIIGSYADDTWWQVWELFGGTKVAFVPDGDVGVPEPAGLALLGLGLLGLGLRRRAA